VTRARITTIVSLFFLFAFCGLQENPVSAEERALSWAISSPSLSPPTQSFLTQPALPSVASLKKESPDSLNTQASGSEGSFFLTTGERRLAPKPSPVLKPQLQENPVPRELQADVPGAPKDAAGSFFLTAGGSRLSPKPSAAVARIVPAALVPEVSAREAKVELPSVATGKELTVKGFIKSGLVLKVKQPEVSLGPVALSQPLQESIPSLEPAKVADQSGDVAGSLLLTTKMPGAADSRTGMDLSGLASPQLPKPALHDTPSRISRVDTLQATSPDRAAFITQQDTLKAELPATPERVFIKKDAVADHPSEVVQKVLPQEDAVDSLTPVVEAPVVQSAPVIADPVRPLPPVVVAAPLPDEPVPADPGPSAASAASPERAPAAAPLPAPLLPEPVAAEPEAVVLEEGEPLPEAMPGPVGVPLPEPVAGVAIPDAESETKVDGEPPKPQPSVESVALPEELRIGVVQEPPSSLQEAPSRGILIKDESLAEEPGPEAPAPEPVPARPGMPPPHDLAPWALVESEDGALPVFDSSMPVIRNEVARLQLEEWRRHVGEAVARHPSVRAAEYAEQESISSIGEAKAQLYPQVSLGLNTDLRRSIRDGKPYATVSDLPVDDEVRLNPNLTVRQLVFDGGATSSRGKAAMARSLAARERRVSTEEGVALRAVATMIELAKLQEQLEFARENLSEVRRLRDMIRARVDAGRDAPSEMLQMNSRVFEARNEVVLLEGRRAEAGARYEEVFGGTPVVLAFPDVFAPIPMSMSGGMDAALRKNPDLLSSKALVDAAAADYKAAWGALYPRLEVEANLTVYDVTRNESDYYDSFVGLKLSHNILDGGLKSSTKARTRSQMERARSEYDNTQRAVELALRRAYANREALIPQYKALQAQLDHKRETQRAYEEQFLAGRRPLNDLVAAQQQVIDTAIRTLDYKAELHRQHFVILSLIGELAKGEGKKM